MIRATIIQALREEAARSRAKAEADAVNAGVAETLTLDHQRGAEFLAPESKRGERAKPIRRLTGLEWLYRKGKITDDQKAVGERYGAIMRVAQSPTSIRSNLNQAPGGTGSRDGNMQQMIAAADRKIAAAHKLVTLQASLRHQGELIGALNMVAGIGMTPREASRNGAQAAALEALVIVALDLLAKAEVDR